jgi:hypothetical protein
MNGKWEPLQGRLLCSGESSKEKMQMTGNTHMASLQGIGMKEKENHELAPNTNAG